MSGRLRVIDKANGNCGSRIDVAWLKDAGSVLFAIMKMELPPRVILTIVEEGEANESTDSETSWWAKEIKML